ncbi:MAG: phosphoglycerate kinase [Actinomycetia bacterium]|nr:phosphoglycerate kinase [Actinomycetes bacterium]
MAWRRLEDLPVRPGSRVLVRVDYNVPLQDGRVTDDTRIRATKPTLDELTARGARVILMSHLGRPKGQVRPELSLAPVARHAATVLGRPVAFAPAVTGPEAAAMVAALRPGDIGLLENLRFDPGEEANDGHFADALASLGDLYVNDAFGTAHRAHASTVGVPERLPGAAGRLMERELWALTEILGRPERPYWAVLGGAKVSDKIRLVRRLLEQVDGLVVGGGMANTFLAAQGHDLGRSRVEVDVLDEARALLREAAERGVPLELPVDVVVASAFAADAPARETTPDAVGAEEWVLDVGPRTVTRIRERLAEARTVFWNGPLGVFEWERFAAGTRAVARLVADLPARVVVGGGDSAAAVEQAGVADRLTHVSTGGGAALEYLEGATLPGVAALEVRP